MAPLRCSRDCGWKGLLQDISAHTSLNCPKRQINCINLGTGCKWQGDARYLAKHVSVCPFEIMKEWISDVEESMAKMAKVINDQNHIIKRILDKSSDDVKNEIATAYPLFSEELNIPFRLNNIPEAIEISNTLKKKEKSIEEKKVNAIKFKSLSYHKSGVTSLTSSDKFLFSGSHDTDICVYDIENDYQMIKKLSGHDYTIWSLYHDGYNLFSGSADKTIKVWTMDDKAEVVRTGTLKSSDMHKIYSLCKGMHSSLLFSSSYKTIGIWDTVAMTLVNKIDAHDDSIWSIKSQENYLFSSSEDAKIKVWDQRNHSLIETLCQDPNNAVLSLALGGGYLFAGTQNATIDVWSSSTLEYITTLSSHSWEIWQLSVVGDYLISGSYDHSIKLWDLKDLRCKKTIPAHNSNVHALHSRKDDTFYSGGGDKCTNVWKLE